MEGHGIERNAIDDASTKFPESEKVENASTKAESRVELSSYPPHLTPKRVIVLGSLTLLWISAAAPVFFITATLCTFLQMWMLI